VEAGAIIHHAIEIERKTSPYGKNYVEGGRGGGRHVIHPEGGIVRQRKI